MGKALNQGQNGPAPTLSVRVKVENKLFNPQTGEKLSKPFWIDLEPKTDWPIWFKTRKVHNLTILEVEIPKELKGVKTLAALKKEEAEAAKKALGDLTK